MSKKHYQPFALFDVDYGQGYLWATAVAADTIDQGAVRIAMRITRVRHAILRHRVKRSARYWRLVRVI